MKIDIKGYSDLEDDGLNVDLEVNDHLLQVTTKTSSLATLRDWEWAGQSNAVVTEDNAKLVGVDGDELVKAITDTLLKKFG